MTETRTSANPSGFAVLAAIAASVVALVFGAFFVAAGAPITPGAFILYAALVSLIASLIIASFVRLQQTKKGSLASPYPRVTLDPMYRVTRQGARGGYIAIAALAASLVILLFVAASWGWLEPLSSLFPFLGFGLVAAGRGGLGLKRRFNFSIYVLGALMLAFLIFAAIIWVAFPVLGIVLTFETFVLMVFLLLAISLALGFIVMSVEPSRGRR